MQPAGKTRVTPNRVNVYLKPETCYLLRPGERGPRRTRVKHGDGDTPRTLLTGPLGALRIDTSGESVNCSAHLKKKDGCVVLHRVSAEH